MFSSIKNKDSKHQRVKVGIIDDEQSCIEQLRDLITQNFPNVKILFEAKSLEEGRIAIKKTSIDLLFLDVQLGDGVGFELIGELDDRIRVVFATAFNQFAVRAFEVNALDYILKPVQPDRLKRAFEVFTNHEKRNKTLPLIRPDDDILLQQDGETKFVHPTDILYIEADKDYTKIHTNERAWYIRRTMNNWETSLPKTLFLRIHRSLLVNMDHVVSIKKNPAGSCQLSINGINKRLTSSRRYTNRLKLFLNN